MLLELVNHYLQLTATVLLRGNAGSSFTTNGHIPGIDAGTD
jgi:hypothetical protein